VFRGFTFFTLVVMREQHLAPEEITDGGYRSQ
jgi:hypothetical protein